MRSHATHGGFLVGSWGDPSYKYQSASLGKCILRALFGLTVEAGLLRPDEPICRTWTGRGELSHPHKYLDEGLHRLLTWRQLLEHQGGFVLESGYADTPAWTCTWWRAIRKRWSASPRSTPRTFRSVTRSARKAGSRFPRN